MMPVLVAQTDTQVITIILTLELIQQTKVFILMMFILLREQALLV